VRNVALSRPIVRAAFCAFLALLPLGTAWNLLALQYFPSHTIRIGPKLDGVTYDKPVILSWATVRDGSFQKAVTSRVTDAMAIRPLLIRVNNEIRYQLFGELTAPNVVRGVKGQLIERVYLNDYCSRTEGMGLKLAADILPKLRDIQNYYENRGGIFIYVVSPSKVAHLPEYFINSVPCPSTPEARKQLVPDYVGALRQGGIHVVDTASLIHSLKGTYPFDLFPQGGVHWNDVGGARAVLAIVERSTSRRGANSSRPSRSPTHWRRRRKAPIANSPISSTCSSRTSDTKRRRQVSSHPCLARRVRHETSTWRWSVRVLATCPRAS
jgi:hypothetical protein